MQPRPGLVLVDGGLGQLHAAARGAGSDGDHRSAAGIHRQARRVDLRVRPGRRADCAGPFSPVLHLVQQVRDEAHRFAVTFHRTRSNASRLRSELDQIPGNWVEDSGEIIEALWESGAGASGGGNRCRAAGGACSGSENKNGTRDTAVRRNRESRTRPVKSK